MGESIYKFARRELPGTFKRGWEHETLRLSKKGKSVWSLENEVLQGYAITLGIAALCVALFGWHMMPFLSLHHFVGWYGLTQANYVEHYGLLRREAAERPLRAGAAAPFVEHEPHRLEPAVVPFAAPLGPPRERASPLSSAARLRGSAATALAAIPACYALAAIPALWFKVMDPKVMAWAGGDLDKINMDPAARARLTKKYGRQPAVIAQAA